MKKLKAFSHIFSFIVIILFSSCREEIIPPDNAGNLNEPLLTITNNSYTFLINASNITTTMEDQTFLQSLRTRVYSVITDHSSGYVEIKVRTSRDNIIYSKLYSSDTGGVFDSIEGSQPDIISIYFNNFTGRLRFQLSKIE